MTTLQFFQAPRQALQNLPFKARPRVDARDVRVPEGYTVEPVMVGLNFPNSVAFRDDGTLLVVEGGTTLKRRPFLGSRILGIDPATGRVEEVVRETSAPIMGLAIHQDQLYATLDGRPSRLVRYHPTTGKRETLVEIKNAGGTHPINGPIVGPDGNLYFGQGSPSINGVMGTTDLANGTATQHPGVHDVPGVDVTLTGENFTSGHPLKPFPMRAKTGAFKPFGKPSKKGETVRGETLCTTSVIRASLDGSEPELLAWGVREGFGMAFDEQGELWVGDNNMTDGGTRPVGMDPDRIWHIRTASRPHGSVGTPDWHGYPDYCADGLSVADEKHKPLTGPQPKPLIENPPEFVGKAPVLLEPHSGVAKMDFCRSDAFGHRGDLFVSLFGSLAPMTTPRKEMGKHGFGVFRVDTSTGEVHPFLHNEPKGPAFSKGPHNGGSAGIERPVDCKFSPDGKSLYVVDIGRVDTGKGVGAWGRTGVLWRITPEEHTR